MRVLRFLGIASAALGVAVVAASAATMNATSGTIGTNVAFGAFSFVPVKKPKATLVPQAGQTGLRPAPMNVFSFDATRIDAQVKSGKVGVYTIVLNPAERGVADETVDGTFTIVPPEPQTLVPSTGPVNVPLDIQGTAFGTGKGRVTIGGKKAKVTSWANDLIRVVVPKKLAAGAQPVVVVGKAGASTAAIAYTVQGGSTGGSARLFTYDAGALHFQTTDQDGLYFTANHNVSQGFLGVGASVRPNGNPSLGVTITGPQLATPMPYDVTTGPTATGYASSTHADGAGSIYQAGPGSNFKVTITAYSGGVLEGTFSGDYAKIVGPGPATLSVTNGRFKALINIVGQ
jgi:hypothetical protein